MSEVQLYLGDCLEFMKTLPTGSVDAVVTDPPYGVNLEYATYKDSCENWYELMTQFIPEAIRVSTIAIFPSCAINRMGWIYQNYPPDWLIAWHKGSPGHAAFIGFNDWEPLLVYGKRKDLFIHDFFSLNNTEKMGGNGHPCPKPILWSKWLVSRCSKPGDTIIDPFMGSGTTGVACVQTGRHFIGCEIDPGYFAIAEKRIKAAQQQPRLEGI